MTTSRPVLWLQLVLMLLALIDIVTGVWAIVSPRGWYDDFPGLGHHWVSVQGPFNEHLASDAGAGFLAVGLALGVAAVVMDRVALLVAAVALLAHSLPHFLFHLLNPASDLHGADVVAGTWGLALEAVIGLVVLARVAWRRPADADVADASPG